MVGATQKYKNSCIETILMNPLDLDFLIKIGITLVAAFIVGTERELRRKPAGISTNALVIGGAMIFTFLSQLIEPGSPARIAANIVTGVGFLGAGIILKSENGTIKNVTTAASIWFSAAIGMLIGFSMYYSAAVAVVFAVIVPRIPHIARLKIFRKKSEQIIVNKLKAVKNAKF